MSLCLLLSKRLQKMRALWPLWTRQKLSSILLAPSQTFLSRICRTSLLTFSPNWLLSRLRPTLLERESESWRDCLKSKRRKETSNEIKCSSCTMKMVRSTQNTRWEIKRLTCSREGLQVCKPPKANFCKKKLKLFKTVTLWPSKLPKKMWRLTLRNPLQC